MVYKNESNVWEGMTVMMTPQEVQDKRFEKAVFGGYDMAGVDEFLEQLTTDYAALYKENAVLKGKLKALMDTVEEYRSVDGAMRRTLFSAQKMADELTKEAQAKADEVIRSANADAAEAIRKYRAENEMELMRQETLKEQTEHFIIRLGEAYAKQMESIRAMQNQVFPAQSATQSELVSQTAKVISTNVQADMSKEQEQTEPPIEANISENQAPREMADMPIKEATQKPAQSETDEEAAATPPRFEFPDLQSQFGQQYSGHGSK